MTTEIKECFGDVSLEIIFVLYFQDDMENIPEMERTEGSYSIIKCVGPENIHTSPTEGNRNSEGWGGGGLGGPKGGTFRRGGGWLLEGFFSRGILVIKNERPPC